jgi:hypothetical protein
MEFSKEIVEKEKIHNKNKYANEDLDHPNFSSHKKHFFILTLSGYPIYSRF